MKCPIDNETLLMSKRQGVEIDYCPACRGVWLDRGELDKIIEPASAKLPAWDGERDDDRYRDERYRDDRSRYDRERYERRPPKRKRSFLSDMFELGGD